MSIIKKGFDYLKYRLRQLSSITVLPAVFKKCAALRAYKKKVGGKVSVILLYEHIGDIIACEPVARYLKSLKTDVVWVVSKKYQELPKMFRDVDMVLPADSVAEVVYLKAFLSGFDVYNLHFDGRLCLKYYIALHNRNKKYTALNYFNYGSILETFSEVAGLPRIKEKPQLMLTDEDRFPEISNGFVAIQVESNESCKMWDLSKWEQLIVANPQIQFVEIGLQPHFSHIKNCNASYCGRLSLTDIAYMIRKSVLFMGIDSSGAHYANALGVPAVILMGKYRDFSQHNPYAVTGSDFKVLYSPSINDLSVDAVQTEMLTLFR